MIEPPEITHNLALIKETLGQIETETELLLNAEGIPILLPDDPQRNLDMMGWRIYFDMAARKSKMSDFFSFVQFDASRYTPEELLRFAAVADLLHTGWRGFAVE